MVVGANALTVCSLCAERSPYMFSHMCSGCMARLEALRVDASAYAAEEKRQERQRAVEDACDRAWESNGERK